ncbi:hypothetical protein JCM16358_19230 [Halanaerocella petrolearia]
MEEIDIEIEQAELLNPLEGAVDYLNKVLLKKELISDALDEEDYEIAWQEFGNLIDGVENLNKLLYNIKNILGLDYSQIKYEGKELNHYIEQFNNFLANKLIIAMENEDYLQISDLINYELEVHIKEYKKIFIRLLNYITNHKFV